MYKHIIDEMATTITLSLAAGRPPTFSLRPEECQAAVLRALDEYWKDQFAYVWTLEDIHETANYNDYILTDDEARRVINLASRHADALTGIDRHYFWGLMVEFKIGRKITPEEKKVADLNVWVSVESFAAANKKK